jgi:hypothetical protein
MSDSLNELVKYRIQQAYETIEEVEFQINNNYLNTDAPYFNPLRSKRASIVGSCPRKRL